jgi:PAS domain-containing protein
MLHSPEKGRVNWSDVRVAHFQGDVKRHASGQPYHMFGTVQDITDRKRAEDKVREQESELRQIVDLVPQQVAVFGPGGEHLYANRFGLDYVGLSLEEWRQTRRRLAGSRDIRR